MENTYLSNERIYLRAVEPEDIDFMYQIENDSSLWEVSSFTVPYSRFVLKQYIENSCSDIYADKQLRLMIVKRSDNCVIGTVDITDFAPLHARGAVGIAVLKEFRREGYAADALFLLMQYVFCFLHLKQLYAYIPVDNSASLKLFSSNGFQECGVLKEWLRSGDKYKDAVLMQCVNTCNTAKLLQTGHE